MSKPDLDAIKARAKAATEGPWEADGGGTSVAAGRLWVAHVVDHQEPDVPVQARADATFIAAARTDVPALVTEVERLREEVAEYAARLARAAFQVDSTHHFHGGPDGRPVCACGFVGSARQRTQTEHITAAVLEAFDHD